MVGQVCLFCGGDASDRDHLAQCDGRQGAVEAAIADDFDPAWAFDDPPPDPPAPPPPATVTITTPRETTARALYQLIADGKLETRRAQVWAGLQALGVATAGEIFEYLTEHRDTTLRYDSNTHARLTELRDLGVIREVGSRVCTVTKQTCLTWTIVPPAAYVGVATVHRCPHCKQIVARDVPVVVVN